MKRPKGMRPKKGNFNEVIRSNDEYCGKSGRKVKRNIDHVFPLAQGDSNDVSNLDISYRISNKSKGR